MRVHKCLLVLPVHRRSYDQYYADHEAYMARNKAKVEAELGKPFAKLNDNMRKSYETMWWWPPWEFNDLVGYVEVGLDQWQRMAGHTYLKRKHFHRDDSVRMRGTSLIATHEVLSYCEVEPVQIEGQQNDAYVAACTGIIETAQKMIRGRVKTATVTLPSWPLSCIDFVTAVRVAQPRW